METGPYSFDGSLLVLRELKTGETPHSVELHTVRFWVQVWNLPAGFFSLTVGRALGDFVGTFIEYDERNMLPYNRDFMRLQVELDIRKPLRREKNIRAEGGEGVKCKFRYERLPNFCYICGRMGHIDRYYEVLFQVPEAEIVRLWSEELRAPPRKNKTLPGEEWIDRSKTNKVGIEKTPGSASGQKVKGNWENDMAVHTPKVFRPSNVESLLGNLGASQYTAGMMIAYGEKAVDGESEVMTIHDEKKRRRDGDKRDMMEEDIDVGNKPTKSPKKGSHAQKNVSQAGLPGSKTCHQP
ncbi:hypothetical protein LINPERHAP1_LOCUS30538 [Linum perenne]